MDNSATGELVAVIIDYHKARGYYADAFRTRSHPVPDKLPEETNTAEWRARYDVLAVQKPFYGPFLQILFGGPSEGQKLAMEFRTKYAEARRRLEDYCSIHGKKESLSALCETDVTAGSGEGIVMALGRHIGMLLQMLPPKDRLTMRINVDFPNVLREARGDLTQQQAVDQLNAAMADNGNVSLESYKGWEAGRHSPQGTNRRAAHDFIRKRLG